MKITEEVGKFDVEHKFPNDQALQIKPEQKVNEPKCGDAMR